MASYLAIQSALIGLGLYGKYIVLRNNQTKTKCKNYIANKLLNQSKISSRDISAINILLCNSTYANINEFISNQCVLASKNPNNMIHFYRIYNENNLDTFLATQFVSNFFSQPIEKILSAFDFINPKNKVPSIIKSNADIYDSLVRIFNTMLIIDLANIFSLIEYFMDLQCIRLLFGGIVPYYTRLVEEIIHNKCNTITYEYLSETYPEEMRDIDRASTPIRISCGAKNKHNKIISIITSLVSLITSAKKMIHKKTQSDIINDINIGSIFGIAPVSNIRFRYVMPHNMLVDFFKYKLFDLTNTNNKIKNNTEDEIESLIIVSDLVMPSNYQIINNEIEIEI